MILKTSDPGPELKGGADLKTELIAGLEEGVRFDDYTRRMFAQDVNIYAITPMKGVVSKSTADVVHVVRTAGNWNVPVVPLVAGTSLAGQTIDPGLVVDVSRYTNKIIDIDVEARTAVVEVGGVQDQLNRAAGKHGRMFGPDTFTGNRVSRMSITGA